MNIIVTLDDNNGMLFNHRRQSRDSAVIQKIHQIIGDKPLYIGSFSEKLFQNTAIPVNISENFLDEVQADDFCFVENRDVKEYQDKINSIYVFHWNRVYPNDRVFDIDLTQWHCSSFEEMTGTSHDNITLEKYQR